MEKKRLKLSISGSSKKTLSSIEQAKSKSKNTVIIEKKNTKFSGKSSFTKKNNSNDNIAFNNNIPKRSNNYNKPILQPTSDFEKRKLAEQRATRRLKGETVIKDNKSNKVSSKRRELKLTVSRALSDDHAETKSRSMASLKRAKQKENRNLNQIIDKENFKQIKRDVNLPEVITIRELANRMAEQSSSIIKHLLGMGVTVTINHTIDADTAEYLVKEFGHKPIREKKAEEIIEKIKEIKSENLKNRPAIVTVMGHVDHGKTSVLDVLREANVVSGEFGGITQHIGAYQINYQNNKITFIDTPGHAAFTEMRARGSKLTDIVVLLEYELIAEDLSGDTLMVEISTKSKKNLDKLVESILLQAELLDLKTDFETSAKGIVLESKIDIGRGPVANIVVTTGTLNKGDYFVSGLKWGKIRAIINDKGKSIDSAEPATPIEIIGINGASKSGDDFIVLPNEKEAKSLCEARVQESKDDKIPLTFVTQDSAFQSSVSEELNIIIKSDVHGSSEAIKNAIDQIKHDEVKPKILLSDIGMVTETDVTLAKASNAVIIAFNVKPSKEAKKRAEKEKISISSFNIIYEVLDFIKGKMGGLLSPDIEEKVIGSAEILEIFKVSKVGKVAGSKVVEGEITQDSSARIIRDGIIIFNGKIGSIFREKNQTKQVSAGLECGITLKDFVDFQKKDIIEVYNATVTERTI